MRARLLLAGFFLFAIVGAVLKGLGSPPPSSPDWDPRVSAENTAPRGARALYLWLAELGYTPRSWRKPLTSLGTEQAALFVLEPSQDITPNQAAALFDWVAEGNALFLAPGFATELEDAVGEWLTLRYDDSDAADVRGDRVVPDDGDRWRYREAGPEERGLFNYPVEEVAFLGGARITDPDGEHSLLLARDGHGLAAEVYLGDGMMVVFAEADVLTNHGLGKASNAELVASLVEDWVPEGAEIWFDEYDHGSRVAGSLGAYLARRRPALFAWAALAAGALVVIRYGRTLVVRPEEEAKKRRRPTEFVEALGGLYARSRAVAPAWSALSEAARRIQRGELAGLRPGGQHDEAEAELENVLAPRAGARTEKDLRNLARAVARTVARTVDRGKERE